MVTCSKCKKRRFKWEIHHIRGAHFCQDCVDAKAFDKEWERRSALMLVVANNRFRTRPVTLGDIWGMRKEIK